MPDSIKICSPFVPGVGTFEEQPTASSEEVATNERVDNIRVMPLPRGTRILGGRRIGGASAAFERLKLWENGRKLRVRFLDGEDEVKTKVAAIAKEWEAVANLKLEFVNSGAADIRVSFKEKGFSWRSEEHTSELQSLAYLVCRLLLE